MRTYIGTYVRTYVGKYVGSSLVSYVCTYIGNCVGSQIFLYVKIVHVIRISKLHKKYIRIVAYACVCVSSYV